MPYKDKAKAVACSRAAYLKRHLREFVNGTEEQRERWREQIRRRPSRSRSSRRKEHLKARYGISIRQWEALFDAQGRCCAICKATAPGWKHGWHTDHEHESGKVRGILCHLCNRTLGNYDVPRFQAFIDYLNGWGCHGGPEAYRVGA